MADKSDREQSVGRVYARALLDQAAAARVEEALGEELAEFVQLLEGAPLLAAYLASPTGDADKREALIEKAFRGRGSDLFVNALQVIGRKGRLGDLRSIEASYRRLLDEMKNRMQVRVTAAVPLSDGARRKLKSTLDRYTGHDVVMQETVDPDILSGLVIYVGDRKIDRSAARQLVRLADRFSARATAEILRSGNLVTDDRS